MAPVDIPNICNGIVPAPYSVGFRKVVGFMWSHQVTADTYQNSQPPISELGKVFGYIPTH
jgi:hypothetical protein